MSGQYLDRKLIKHMGIDLPRSQTVELTTGDTLHVTDDSKLHYETLCLRDGNSFCKDAFLDWFLKNTKGEMIDRSDNLAKTDSVDEIYRYANGALLIRDKKSGEGSLGYLDGSIVCFSDKRICSISRDGITVEVKAGALLFQ